MRWNEPASPIGRYYKKQNKNRFPCFGTCCIVRFMNIRILVCMYFRLFLMGFFTNWFTKLSPIFMNFFLTWCKRKRPRTAALSLVKPKATENGYFFKFIHVYSSIIYTCTKLMVRHNSFKHVHIMLFTKVHHANSNSDQIWMG